MTATSTTTTESATKITMGMTPIFHLKKFQKPTPLFLLRSTESHMSPAKELIKVVQAPKLLATIKANRQPFTTSGVASGEFAKLGCCKIRATRNVMGTLLKMLLGHKGGKSCDPSRVGKALAQDEHAESEWKDRHQPLCATRAG
ncbi:hypothetical protein BGZ72_010891 [Mortierella alpina]|nr:hypothetical protein BGZ72_010891 [Mortierella alpina]